MSREVRPGNPAPVDVFVRLINSRSVPITLVIEPWAEQFEMPAGSVVEVVGRGPAGDGIEVDDGADRITIWGWPGSTVRLFRDGVELAEGDEPRDRTPVPSMPEIPLPSPADGDRPAQSPRRRSA